MEESHERRTDVPLDQGGPGSASSIAMMALPAAPAHAATPTPVPRALLVGKLGFEGGAPPGGFHPTGGSVEVEFDSQPLVLLQQVGPSGKFQIRLAAERRSWITVQWT